jgi:ribosomal protein S18 acetylase RimI-like enzyme
MEANEEHIWYILKSIYNCVLARIHLFRLSNTYYVMIRDLDVGSYHIWNVSLNRKYKSLKWAKKYIDKQLKKQGYNLIEEHLTVLI